MTRPILIALRPLAALAVGVLLVAAAAGIAGDRADAVSPESTDVVYVAAGFDFPDALVGAVIAASHNAPVLTVRGPDAGDRVPEDTAAELERLEPERIVIFGGPAAVSEAVETELGTYTDPEGQTERLSGDDRFGTAAAISAAIPDKVDDADHLDGVDSTSFARDFHDHMISSRALDPTAADYAPVPLALGATTTEILTRTVSLPDGCGDLDALWNVRVDASGTVSEDGAEDENAVVRVGIDDPTTAAEDIDPTSRRTLPVDSSTNGNFSTQLLMALPEGDQTIALEGRVVIGDPGADAEVNTATMLIEVLGYQCPIELPDIPPLTP